MKADQLKEALRKLIKEEVKKAVAEEVNRAMGKVLVEMVREIKAPTLGQPMHAARPAIQTKNSKLNSALNETAQNYTPLGRTSDASPSMAELLEGGDFEKIGGGEEVYEKPKFVDDGTKIGFLKSIITESAGTPSVLDKGAEVPDVLKGVFKRDFRKVMKAIDEKKKFGGSGVISAAQVLNG